MKITTLEQAEKRLQQYVPNVSNFTGDNLSLERMWPILNLFGNPQNKLKAVHIAGTSGKTSTAYYIASILTSSGKKTGLTVSPHVYSITERIQLNSKPISKELFCSYLEEFLEILDKSRLNPSYFELLIIFSLWVFDKEKVDYAILETGMGGLLDGTNVVTREDKICVITDIGFDHMHILGNTISEIASQKAGIIHTNNEVFMYKQDKDVIDSISKRVKSKSAHLFFVNEVKKLNQELPTYQQRNYYLALQVCNFVAKRDNFEIISINPNNVYIPGRMEFVNVNDTSIIIDGAHNEQKIKAFVESFNARFPNQKAVVLIALKEGKEYKSVVDALSPIVLKFIVTTFDTSQDLPAKAQNPEIISRYISGLGIKSEVFLINEEAVKELASSSEKLKIITGSFYLIGQIRKYLESFN